MKLTFLGLSMILAVVSSTVAQRNRVEVCRRVDSSRDSLFIESVRVEEASSHGDQKIENRVILRLKNNSTCSINVMTTDFRKFVEPLGSKPTVQQLRYQKIRHVILDGELVDGLQIYTSIEFGDSLLTTRTNRDSDMGLGLTLKGNSSLLFAISIEALRKKQLILVPFEFEWETKPGKFRSEKFVRLSGETHHLVWFSYSNLPKDVLSDIVDSQ